MPVVAHAEDELAQRPAPSNTSEAAAGDRGAVMGDTPVEVALDCGRSTRKGPLWDAATARLWWVDITGRAGALLRPGLEPATPPGARPGSRAAWCSSPAGEPVVASPGRAGRAGPAHRRDGPAGAGRAGPAGEPRQRRQGRRPGPGVGRHDGLRQAAAERRPVPGRRRPGDPRGRRPDHLQRARLRRARRAPLPGRHRPSTSSTCSTSTRRRALCRDAGASWTSARRRFWPDGMTVDDDGMLWVALGRAGAVHRYRPDGTLDGVVEVPTSNPTSVAFGGRGRRATSTSPRPGSTARPRADQPLAGAIFRCRPGVTGRPSPRYADAHPAEPRRATDPRERRTS